MPIAILEALEREAIRQEQEERKQFEEKYLTKVRSIIIKRGEKQAA